jgi:hypothetical protein
MPRIRRPSITHGVAAVASILSDVSTTDYYNAANPANDAAAGGAPPATKLINPALVVSAKKIFKVLRVLDPRADNAHRGKERVVRLNKFRSYVNGKYSPDGVSKPPFRRDDVLILFLGTKLDGPGDTYIPGLLRACGTPSSNHSRAGGNAELLKKSALPAMDLLRYLVCDLHITEANANSAVFGEVFCTLPPEELRQLRLPLHLAGFGGKREGSREDAGRILTHYLLSNASVGTSFSCANVLDELLGPTGSEARLGYGGWLLTQTPELRKAASDAGIVDVLPTKRQAGAVTLVKTDSDNPLTFAKSIMEEIDDSDEDGVGNEMTGARPRNTVAAPGPGRSRRLSDQAFGVSARNVSARSADTERVEEVQVSIEEFASLKSELTISRATVESLQTTVSRLSDTVADLLDRAEKKDRQTSNNMNFLRQENAKMREQLDEMLLSQNEMKSKMGLLRISKESVHGSSDGWKNNHKGNNRKSYISNHDSNSSEEDGNEGAGIGMSIRNVFNSMRNEQVSEDTLGTDGRSVDSLLWDD